MSEPLQSPGRRVHLGTAAVPYLLRLVGWLWLLHLLTFALFDLLPSPEFGIAGWAGIDPAVLAATRERLGLHGSWFAQYWTSLLNLFHGNLGQSLVGGYPVAELFSQRLVNSLPQWFASVMLLIIVPVPVAMLFCSRRVGLPRRILLFSSNGLLIPQFLACCAGQALFVLAIAPVMPLDLDSFTRRSLAVISATLAPLAIGFIAAANTAERCAQQPFVVTYLATGANWWQIRRHLLINVAIAMKPLLARLALYVIMGSIFSEPLFSINGVGALFWNSLRAGDMPTMMAFVLFTGAVTLSLSTLESAKR
jgi:peptide/nickel transport system permease protein